MRGDIARDLLLPGPNGVVTRRGSMSVPCPICKAEVGARCVKFRNDADGNQYPVGRKTHPCAARVAAARSK
jgi:hypothetical protein